EERKTERENNFNDYDQIFRRTGVAFVVNDKNLLATAASLLQLTVGADNRRVCIKDPDKKKNDGPACRDRPPLGPKKIMVYVPDGDQLTLVNVPIEFVKEVIGEPTSSLRPIREDLVLLQPEKQLPGKPAPIANYEPATGSEVRAVGYTGVIDNAYDESIK